jgi:ParB-like chromosome segregation protein Spo0J
MHALKEGASRAVIERPIDNLTPNPRNARKHPKKQLRQLANSIERFGFTNPVLIDDAGQIMAGHGRVEAARLLGLRQVPTLTLSHLSPAERRAYMLADNKLALNAGWDPELLAEELQLLIDDEFDLDLTGFSLAEIDAVLDDAREASTDARDAPGGGAALLGN